VNLNLNQVFFVKKDPIEVNFLIKFLALTLYRVLNHKLEKQFTCPQNNKKSTNFPKIRLLNIVKSTFRSLIDSLGSSTNSVGGSNLTPN